MLVFLGALFIFLGLWSRGIVAQEASGPTVQTKYGIVEDLSLKQNGSLVWDDEVKRCEWESTTCPLNKEENNNKNYCMSSCAGIKNGDYQSCQRCDGFVKCAGGRLFEMDCARTHRVPTRPLRTTTATIVSTELPTATIVSTEPPTVTIVSTEPPTATIVSTEPPTTTQAPIGPTVQTKYGAVEGLSLKQNGLPYDGFFGVPFASNPSGAQRWSDPTPPKSWQGSYNATYFRPYCTQLISPAYKLIGLPGKGSEDCLYLNIYVPEGVADVKDMPVMVFIYGGAYVIGATDMYPGEDLAVSGKVIVVSISYRLGTMGFLSTGDRYAEGNWGLLDQVEALKWVKGNIASFGGDANRITIFGQSAGAASVSHLSLSPIAKGLFQRVVMISGSAATYYGYTDYQPATTRSTALTVVCPPRSSKMLLKCMKKRKPAVLDIAGLLAPILLGRRVPNWVPRVDGYMVQHDPYYAISKGANKHVDMLTGHCIHDAALLIYLNPLGLGYNKYGINLAKNIHLYKAGLKFGMSPYQNGDELLQLILNQYPKMFDEDEETRTKVGVQLLTDFVFAAPATYEAENHVKSSGGNKRTYVYEYAYRNSFLKYEDWIEASHIDDLYSVLGDPYMKLFRNLFLRGRYKKDDKEMKNTVQKYYANFAYSGNPNQGPHTVNEFWPQYENTNKSQMVFRKGDSSAQPMSAQQYENNQFWTVKFHRAAIPVVEVDENIGDNIQGVRDILVQAIEIYERIMEAIENKDQALFGKVMTVVAEYIESYGKDNDISNETKPRN